MAMSKPVVTLILSLQHELTSKGIRVQVVLPGRTATDGWDVAGFPWQKMPPEIVMPVEDMVDAALVGLDQGELVTIPGLHDGDEWTCRRHAEYGALSFGALLELCPETELDCVGRNSQRKVVDSWLRPRECKAMRPLVN